MDSCTFNFLLLHCFFERVVRDVAQHFYFFTKHIMKPQQQDTEARKESAVYVQTPEGETVNVKTNAALSDAPSEEDAAQTAENTPTKSSGEVTSGEAG